MKKQILKRILSSISATTLAVTSLGLNTVLAANAESAAPAAQTKEQTVAADHVHDDCCGGCCGEEAPAGQGVTIALLDAGVTNYETAGKTSFIDDDTIDSDHGNDMMSILKDTAPGADVLDVRVLDDEGKGTYANVEKGIRWAVDNSADIIVMSFVNVELRGFSDSVFVHEVNGFNFGKKFVAVIRGSPSVLLEFAPRDVLGHVFTFRKIDAVIVVI